MAWELCEILVIERAIFRVIFVQRVYVTNSKVKYIRRGSNATKRGKFPRHLSPCLSHPTILTANRHAAKCFHVRAAVHRSELIMILISPAQTSPQLPPSFEYSPQLSALHMLHTSISHRPCPLSFHSIPFHSIPLTSTSCGRPMRIDPSPQELNK